MLVQCLAFVAGLGAWTGGAAVQSAGRWVQAGERRKNSMMSGAHMLVDRRPARKRADEAGGMILHKSKGVQALLFPCVRASLFQQEETLPLVE